MTSHGQKNRRRGLAFACAIALAGLTGCTGLYALSQCDTGTQEQLASPTPGQTGVSSTIGQIIMVANGNGNALYNSYGQWQITLTDNFGNTVVGGPLSLVPFPSGPHPYPSDFYYASSIQQLATGRTYTAFLVRIGGSCPSIPLGSFST
jgi:hypothetical protein